MRHASASAKRSISAISPASSASGTNSSGGTTTPPRRQRSRASTSGQPPVGEVDDRLHEQLDLLELERAVERADDLDAPRRGLAQAGVEQLEAPASSLLGRVHGDVRVADQIGRRLRIAARERDADTAADVDLAARDAERLRERGQDATGDLLGRPGVAARQVGSELVAAEAREHVALAQRRLQPAAGLAQQRIARLVPVAVVDELEAVDVDEQHGARRRAAPRQLPLELARELARG